MRHWGRTLSSATSCEVVQTGAWRGEEDNSDGRDQSLQTITVLEASELDLVRTKDLGECGA